MNTELLRRRMAPVLKALNGRCVYGHTPVIGLKKTPCGYNEWSKLREDSSLWQSFSNGEPFGGQDAHFCFKGSVRIPENFLQKHVVCIVSTGAEDYWNNNNPQFIAYLNGRLACGLDVNHTEIDLSLYAMQGEEHGLALYAYCNTKQNDVFLRIDTAVRDDEVTALYYDISVPFEVCCGLADTDERAILITKHLNNALNLLDMRDLFSAAFTQSIRAARAYMETEFYAGVCGKGEITEACVGHTHIDVAWLWSLAQTREKAIRSFASVNYLMAKYPEYIFMSSQPQLYSFVKRDCPELYANIRTLIASGRWEPEGSMWVEADTNMSSGESLIRQFMHGKGFFKREFGCENRILWLPDAFGFSGALPQIMKQCGVDYFMTTKMSWNDTNCISHDIMRWRGIDQSEVLAYFISTKDCVKTPDKNAAPSFNTTYNGVLNASHTMGCRQRFQDKELTQDVLQCYGYGDGGGGPTAEMLETQRRLERGIPGAPATRQSTVRAFFEKLRQSVSGKKLPLWCGEFYFEYHRGIYTSIAQNKRFNRLCEFKNADAELFCGMNIAYGTGLEYPEQQLLQNWELTLLNQFHDILPGSSIKQVYDDSKKQYDEVLARDSEIITAALNCLAQKIEISSDGVLVFNQLGFMRDTLVFVSASKQVNGVFDGDEPVAYSYNNGVLAFIAKNLPAKGYKHYSFAEAEPCARVAEVNFEARSLQTAFYEIEWNEFGELTKIYDKAAQREVIQSGKCANELQFFEDRPERYDAWNIEAYYKEHMWRMDTPAQIEIIENSPVRCCISVKHKYLNSEIRQQIAFYAHTKRIDFATKADWHEQHTLLKAAFPVDIASTRARYEIQFGSIERDTHTNTGWDEARFEVCAHKWADLSEAGYGVALLNDCKYGYDISDGVMRLSLLRSPTYPNPLADQGEHSFTYSLLPHEGDYRQGRVVHEGYDLNCPSYARALNAQSGVLPSQMSMISTSESNIIIETVKKAQNDGSLIVRLYEAYGKRTQAKLLFGFNVQSVFECDALEINLGTELAAADNCVQIQLKPFEFKTIRIKC